MMPRLICAAALAACFAGLLLLSPRVYAQADLPADDAVALTLGTALAGEVTKTDFVLENGAYADVYSIPVQQGQRYSVVMTTDAFDTYLYVLDEQINIIAENDDGEGIGTNSRVDFVAPSTGTFYILASSFNPNTAGVYTIIATQEEEQEE